MRLLGQVTNGIYADDGADLHPDVLHEFYGTSGTRRHRQRHQTGAGHPPEEEEEEGNEEEAAGVRDDLHIPQNVADTQQSSIRHEAIPVPVHGSPFADDLATLEVFFNALEAIQQEGILPAGYRLLPHEQDDGYEVDEIIHTGKRGRKELVVSLPEHIWWPRTKLWGQALHLMTYIQLDEE